MNEETTFTTNARVLSAASTPYEINGNSGISHKVRLLIGSAIFPLTSTKEQIEALQDYINKDVTATIEFTSVRERLGAKLHRVDID
jgi:tRNA U38,U39,U40 pseudouridine synthase TruA